ncbi:MAG TPA: transposase [Pirellulaceae bacterium]|nr:transposase [Pirellulaceae bacterium]
MAPGSPWQNGYAESFHNRLRDEFLSQEEFKNLSAARELTRRWRRSYNEYRPHSSLGYDTPSQFANRWSASASTAAAPRSTLQRASDLPQPVPS